MNIEDQDKKTLEIARRTKTNLDYMYEHKAEIYEFTQLINSMLGMLICLREEYFKEREVKWEEIPKIGLALPSPSIQQKANSFSDLIRNLRHGFAHNDFSLKGAPEITGIEIRATPKGKPVWTAELSEGELKEIANLFIEFVEKELGKHITSG